MFAQDAIGIVHDHSLKLQLAHLRLHIAQRHVHHTLLLVLRQAVEEGVEVERRTGGALLSSRRVAARKRKLRVVARLGGGVVAVADAVVDQTERVAVVQNLLDALSASVGREQRGIGDVKVAVVVEDELFRGERLSLIGHRCRATQLLRLHVLEPLPTPQREQQVLLVGGGLQHTRVGEDDLLVLIAARHAIDHNAIELTCLHVLLLHVDVAAGDAVVEDALWNFQLRTLLLHRNK